MSAAAKARESLDRKVIRCKKCPRLIEHCKNIAKVKRKSFADQKYWGKPVADFGDPKAKVLIVGLAPAAHGANRTGRMFTGDRSGDWLYRALHKAKFASQAESIDANDGLKLKGAIITAVCHCAPPDNKPLREEIENCRPYLTETIEVVPWKAALALGTLGWNATFDYLKAEGAWSGARPKFGHCAEVELEDGRVIMGSYHPSQQNTFTGRLTEPMFDKVFSRLREII